MTRYTEDGEPAPDRGTGGEVLTLLRGGASARPRFDPGLAGGLRAWLEDAAYDVVARRGDHAPPLFLGVSQLLGSPRIVRCLIRLKHVVRLRQH